MRVLWLAGVLLFAGPACGKRAVPYRFRGPVVSSVNAAELPPRDDDTAIAAGGDRRAEPRRLTPQPIDPASPAIGGSAATSSADPLATTLRGLVGHRDRRGNHVQFAFAALAAIGVSVAAPLAELRDGAALVARRAAGQPGEVALPLLGDLVVFDRVFDRKPASLVGVVVGVDARRTVEFIYLDRGVVRRGFLNRDRAEAKRDESGKILNTIIRQVEGRGKKGAGDLAGQLFATYLRLDQLGE